MVIAATNVLDEDAKNAEALPTGDSTKTPEIGITTAA